MPRAKATKKPVAELPLTNANGETPTPAETSGGSIPAEPVAKLAASKSKARGKKTPAAAAEANDVVEAEAEEQLQPAVKKSARGGKKKQSKDAEIAVDIATEELPAAKPKGRAKKTTPSPVEEAEPASAPAPIPTKSRAKREKTPVVEEPAVKATKSRAKKEKTPATVVVEIDSESEPEPEPEPETVVAAARGRKKKEPVVAPEQPEPAKRQRGKKEKSVNEELPEAVPKAKSKSRHANKRLADSEISDVLNEADPEKELELEPEPKPASKRRAKQSKEEEEVSAEPAEPVKKRGKKAKTEQANEEPINEPAPAAKKRARKPVASAENEIEEVIKPARSRKRAAVVASAEDIDADDDDVDGSQTSKAKKPAPPISTDAGNYDKADFGPPPDKEFNLKISSWNVAGLRAWIKKDGLKFLEYEEPDIFCLQETKCANDQLPDEVERLPGYHPYWLCMPGGHAGVAVYSKIMPINVEYGIGDEEFDSMGRMITAEYEKFYLINVYVPNSGRKLVNLTPRMRWEQLFQAYVQRLDALKPVIICGDMNVSHLEIDLANPKSNTRNAGFTKEERDKMTELLGLGFVDTFRHLYPERTGAYSFWTYMAKARARNIGWRLDYCIVSQRFLSRVVENCMRSQCLGSDHCPITVFLNL